jgi:hypothetical protein
MKHILLVAILALPILVSAQDDKKKKNSFFENSYIGAYWGPDMYFWKDKAPAGNTDYTYNPHFSYTGGVEFIKGTKNERLFINVGVQHSVKSFLREDKCLTCGTDYVPLNTISAKYTEIPVSAMFLITNSKLDVIGTFGFTYSFLRKADGERNAYNGTTEIYNATNSFNKANLGLHAGVGFNYTINLHLSWGMNVIYRQPFSQFTPVPAVSAFGIGFNTGFYYKFD